MRSRSTSASTAARCACCPPASGSRSASSGRRATSRSYPGPRSTGGCGTSSAASRRLPRALSGPAGAPIRRRRVVTRCTVLLELRVENLLLLDRAELRLAPGLNVLTGETGAGKTLLAHALDLLLGGRARSGIVRTGAAEAYVEGVFSLPAGLRALLGDRVAPDADELVLARRVSSEGRTRAYLNGRSASVADLREAAEGLISFYGQHEHRKLTLASSQLELLDGACGAPQV